MKTKSIKNALTSVALTLSLAVATPAHALFGAGDVVFDPSQAANMVTEFEKWKDQYDQMKSTIDQGKETYNSMTGKRGYGSFQNITTQARNYLPKNFSDVMTMLSSANPSYSGIADVIRKYIDANAVLTTADLDAMKLTPRQRQLFTDSRNNTGAIQAMANEALQNASVRFNLLQSLAYEINETTDPKAIAELQARIQVEQNMLANEQNKLKDLSDGMQARKDMVEQQTMEVAVQQTGDMNNVQQPDLSNIRFGN